MQVELRHSPSYAVARLHLAPGEQFLGESGVMVMQSFGVTVQSPVLVRWSPDVLGDPG